MDKRVEKQILATTQAPSKKDNYLGIMEVEKEKRPRLVWVESFNGFLCII
jgi:hypothetical protein